MHTSGKSVPTIRDNQSVPSSEVKKQKKRITSTFNGRSAGSCICLRLDLYMSHVSLLCFYVYRLYLTCDMDKSSLRHIHDPVLLSLKVEVICYINFLAYQELKLTFHSHNNQVYILL